MVSVLRLISLDRDRGRIPGDDKLWFNNHASQLGHCRWCSGSKERTHAES